MFRKLILTFWGCVLFSLPLSAQFIYGTSGSLRMPTADMNPMGTIMLGANHLDWQASQPRRPGYDTDSYYLNATLFPWLEVGYYMMLRSETFKHMSHYVSQDRSFHAKLRLCPEGYHWSWMPQIVFGANDPLTHLNSNDKISVSGQGGNNHLTRFYLAFTKHFSWQNVATIGTHLSVIKYAERAPEANYVRPAAGANFRFATPGENFAQKAINGLDIMAEYDARSVNIGASYALFKEHFWFFAELNRCQYPSFGLQFRIRAYK